jgi:hypothetical protein
VEDWALRAIQRWPNVPALFGWLGLGRRGHWLIKGEIISRPQIIDTINRNYEADVHGRWFFQNGPQRGYVTLDYTPLILHVDGNRLVTHTQLRVERPSQVCLDEEGSLVFQTEHGAGLLIDTDLDWALERITSSGSPVDDAAIEAALGVPSGQATRLEITIDTGHLKVIRLDQARIVSDLGFVREPRPLPEEAVSTRIAD